MAALTRSAITATCLMSCETSKSVHGVGACAWPTGIAAMTASV